MKIIRGRPPNYSEILLTFPGACAPGVIFSHAPDIYAPSGNVPSELIAHEQVHLQRQAAMGVSPWWAMYLADRDFRYHEELLAHRAEYSYLSNNGNRSDRRRALKMVAAKLAAPLYGKMITTEQAMKDIQGL